MRTKNDINITFKKENRTNNTEYYEITPTNLFMRLYCNYLRIVLKRNWKSKQP